MYCISSLNIMLIVMSSKKTFCTLAFSMCLLFHISKSSDTITLTNFLSDAKNESLVSSDGNFRLGFFSPRNSFNRYVGIWFNKISEHNVVWVANRDRPLKEKNGIFKISTDGNIVVYSGANESELLWSSNISHAIITFNSTAKLFSSGNFVLTATNAINHNKIEVWQSFDHPTDTGLAGMKFGMDKRNGLRRVLTSWKSEEDPATGEYSAAVEVDGPPQFYVYKKSSPVWRAGPWNGQSLSGIPTVASRLKTYEMDYTNESSLFSSTYVNNNDEVYMTFDYPGPGIFKTLQLDTTGMAREQMWHSGRSGGSSSNEEARTWATFWVSQQDQCDQYMHCGPSTICNTFNSATECSCLPGYEPESPGDHERLKCIEKRKELHICGKGIGEGFLKLPGIKLPDAKFSSFFGYLSLQECEEVCLKSCNCTAYASADVNVGGRGCYAWFGELNDVKQYHSVDGQDFYLRLDAAELAAKMMLKRKKSHSKRMLIIIIAVVVPVAFLFSCFLLYRWRIKGHNEESQKLKNRSNIELTCFCLDTVLTATGNFSSANKLGQGGFGPVYKGQLSNGLEIAVKRLSKNSGQGISEFKNEASLIAKLQHKNLVRLIGCCIEEEEKMLIYEYMSNKSLDYFIFDETRKSLLDWPKRHQIIVGIARGIMYLHQDSRLKVIHRDLKASNILLDNEMNPKISDFGTARIFEGNQSQANTSNIVGTYGYMSPEYGLYGFFSEKSDVFSFGVLLLEIISGKKNTELVDDSSTSNLMTFTWEHWKNGTAEDIIDTSIREDSISPLSEVVHCMQLGLLCVQDNVKDRPTMSDVVYMLSNASGLPAPKQPVFAVERSTKESNTIVHDLNDVTITEPSGR